MAHRAPPRKKNEIVGTCFSTSTENISYDTSEVNEVRAELEAELLGRRQGGVLVVTQRVSFEGAEGMVTVNYLLSADGKVLRKTSHVAMDAGTFDTKTVYDKQ